MRTVSKLATGAAVAALLAFSPPAGATIVTDGSGPVVFNFDNPVTVGSGSTDLTATLTLSNFNFSGLNTVTFSVDISNTTQQGTLSTSDFNSIRLVSFGFNTDPNATSVVDNSAIFTTSVDNQQPLPSIGKLDFCAYAGPNCAGGAGGGLTPGGEDIFTVTMTFPTDINSLDIGIGSDELAGIKWQTAFGSFENTSCTLPTCLNPTPEPVPEPASLAILGSSLAIFGLLRRRRQRNTGVV
jgi:hypothetical protein